MTSPNPPELNTLERLTLKAFLRAIDQLDSVPSEVQSQLQQLVPVSSASVSRLDAIAKTHPPLYTLYQEARLVIGDDSERNKGPRPEIDPQARKYNQEEMNILDRANKAFSPPPSKSGLFKRILNLFNRRKT